MGFTLYLIAEDGEYIHYGKEIELYANHSDAVATLMFLFSKMEMGKWIRLRRFDIHDSDEPFMKKDVSQDYLEYAKEELSTS